MNLYLKPLPIALFLIAVSNTGVAASGVSGAYGLSLNHNDLFSAEHNPAMGSFLISDKEKWRMNYVGAFYSTFEFGNVNNFADELDELIDILDDPDNSNSPADETLDRFNALLIQSGEEGYINVETDIKLPIFPIYYHMDQYDAVIGFDAGINTEINASILDDELTIIDDQFVTGSSLYLKSAIESYISINYSLPVWSLDNIGTVYVGTKLKLLKLELSKQVSALQDLAGSEIEDVIENQYDDNLNSTTNLSIDIGAILEADKYRLGFTIYDINSPSFDFGTVGVNCDRFDAPSDDRTSCEVAAFFVSEGEISAREEHTKKARSTIFGSYKLTPSWWVNGSYDLAEYESTIGLDNQYVTLSSTYNSKGSIFSGIRVAYESNQSREGLETLAAGISLFKALNIDLFYGLENIEVDGDSAPRRLGASLSISESF